MGVFLPFPVPTNNSKEACFFSLTPHSPPSGPPVRALRPARPTPLTRDPQMRVRLRLQSQRRLQSVEDPAPVQAATAAAAVARAASVARRTRFGEGAPSEEVLPVDWPLGGAAWLAMT